MPLYRILFAALAVLAFSLPAADAQYRGGRQDRGGRTDSNRGGNDLAGLEFKDRLWYGAGGSLGFSGNGRTSFAQVGLTPQIGYKFTPWLSAGPRLGVTLNSLKGDTDLGDRQRSNTWDFSAGVFARGKLAAFYLQTEVGYLSQESTGQDQFGRIVIDRETGEPLRRRFNDTEWLVGLGYNPGRGQGLGTDIGIFYNLFDSVESVQSPITFRVMFTFNY